MLAQSYTPSQPVLTAQERLLLEEYALRKDRKRTARSFLKYMRRRAPWMVIEEFHILIAEDYQKLIDGQIDRYMLFAPPRGGKSLMTSVLLPEWWIGNLPRDQILHVSYATPLVEEFGRQIKNTLANDTDYQALYPGTQLSKDSKASAKWATTKGGLYNSAGVGTGIAGKGFNLGIIDDPISEQDAPSKTLRRSVNNWYGPGFYTRRMPERNAIVITQTRWALDDLSGFLLKKAADPKEELADKWFVREIPALVDQKTADELNRIAENPEYAQYLSGGPRRYEPGDSFSPRRWSVENLKRSMAALSKKDRNALYQQRPIAQDGALLKAEYWKKWTAPKLPKFEYLLQSWDTAFEPEEKNDYSVCTLWGIFRRELDGRRCAMLVGVFRDKPEFPDLRRIAKDLYDANPIDSVIIEKKASGHSLIQELRRIGVPVRPMSAKGSKESRANKVLVLFEQGAVYYVDRLFTAPVIEECNNFPAGEHDDCVDSVVHALSRFRDLFLIDLEEDYQPPEDADIDEGQKRSYAVRHSHYSRATTNHTERKEHGESV